MKQPTVYAMAFLLVVATSAALAGGRHHGGHSGRQQHGHGGQHFDQYRHPPRHGYRGGYYRPSYYPSYFGAALLGSAFAYSLYHTHNGASCYEAHSTARYQQRTSRNSEVIGCHKVEQLADGSERRVDVPMSQCQ